MAKIFVSFNIVSTSDIILVVRESSAPLAEVFRQFYAAPHSQRNLTVDPLNPVMHIVQIWTTTDGTTLLQLKGQCDIDASLTSNLAFDFIQFIVGRGNGTPSFDPVADQPQYVNTNLDGKTYVVFKPGFGGLYWGVDIQTITGGGFEYINGQMFSADEEYTVMVSNLVASSVSSSGSGYPSDVVSISGSITFSSLHFNKLIEVSSSNPLVGINITDINVIPDGTVFGINTHNYTAAPGFVQATALQLPSGKYVQLFGINRNIIYLGLGEEITLIKKGAYLRIVDWVGDHRRLGERIFTDGKPPVNSLPETGSWYLKSSYPRIFEWYVNELPLTDLGTGTDDVTPDAANKTKWIIGANKFWVPDRRNLFNRNTDGTRVSGDLQAEMVGPHTHPVKPPESNSTAGFGKTATGNDAAEGTGIAIYNTNNNSGTENRPANVATNVYRII